MGAMSSTAFPVRRKPRLLIVEDDADLRVLVQFAARRSEAFSTICTAEDGQAALDLVEAGLRGERADLPPDVVFTDWNMPRLTGVELARELRRRGETHDVAVALFTSAQSAFEREQARNAGVCAHFLKPAGLAELTAIMKSLPAFCRDRLRQAEEAAHGPAMAGAMTRGETISAA